MADVKNTPQLKTGYSVYDLFTSVLGASDPDVVQANTSEYIELLNSVREKISEEHANTLNGILTNPNAHSVLVPIILNYITDYVNRTNDLTINISRTAERIYQDMAGFGILTPYLNDPYVEEININAWNSIEIFWSDHSKLLEETFASPQDCVDIIKKMVRIGGVHMDYSQPIIDSFIGDGTRISATLPPINQDGAGATASIRKQTYKDVTREKYLEMGFATPRVFDFIRTLVLYGVSIGFAGSPGAGKTTYMTFLLRDFMDRKTTGNNRVITIEEAREIEISKYEQQNPSGNAPRLISRSLQWNTKSGEHPVTARQLIRHTLRYDPQIIVPAEMRGEEAIEAVESGLTGIQIISSFHAWGAEDGYIRVLSMCQMGKNTSSEASLLQSIIRAFPVMVFIKKDDDGVRRIHEVFEATGIEDGHVVGNKLFRFVRTKVVENEDGRILSIEGKFVQIQSISKKLRHLLIQNGARRDYVDQFYFENPADNPDSIYALDDSQVEVVTISESFVPKHNDVVAENEDNDYTDEITNQSQDNNSVPVHHESISDIPENGDIEEPIVEGEHLSPNENAVNDTQDLDSDTAEESETNQNQSVPNNQQQAEPQNQPSSRNARRKRRKKNMMMANQNMDNGQVKADENVSSDNIGDNEVPEENEFYEHTIPHDESSFENKAPQQREEFQDSVINTSFNEDLEPRNPTEQNAAEVNYDEDDDSGNNEPWKPKKRGLFGIF